MTDGLAHVDGKVVDLAEARVQLNDRGFLLGDGVFETLRTAGGGLVEPAAHRDRLVHGLQAIGLDPGVAPLYDDALQELAEAGQEAFGDALYLRVNLTTGPMSDIAGGDGVAVTGICKPFAPYPMQYYSRGVHLVQSRHRRDPSDPLVGVKSLSFLPHVAARREAFQAAAHDAVLLNIEGRVAEATTSNLFAKKGDQVYAPGPGEGALAGVTRGVVLELIDDAGLEVQERMQPEQFADAEEAWLTNTTGGIVPVTRFGDATIGDGNKGDFTSRLSHAYEERIYA